MLNILILCKKEEIIETIKNEIRMCVGSNIYIHQEWKLEELKNGRTRYLFVIVDIDEFRIIKDSFKKQEKWINSYYIYLSHDNQMIEKAIGYNALGYLTYDKVYQFRDYFKKYLLLVASTYHCYFKTEDGIEAFKFNEIMFFEMKDRKIKMQTIYGQFYLVNYKLVDIIKIMDTRFILANKSAILNIDYIKRITNENIILMNYKLINKEFKLSKKQCHVLKLNKKSGCLDKIRQK